MKLVHTVEKVRHLVLEAKAACDAVGLVPTMGALHEGHLTLIKKALEECSFVVVSVFVNPTQFGPSEDFDKYPRTLQADAVACQSAGVDVVFAPSAEEMYPDGYNSWVEVGGITADLEGALRPIHFRGVATVCTKLFGIVNPDIAFFGQKDYQQLTVIKKMVKDLNFPLEIRRVDTVREADGLAMSSRNRYLSSEERASALVLSKSLFAAKDAYESGVRDSESICKRALEVLASEPAFAPDYFVIRDAETLATVDKIEKPIVALVAGKLGTVRLIDNVVLGE